MIVKPANHATNGKDATDVTKLNAKCDHATCLLTATHFQLDHNAVNVVQIFEPKIIATACSIVKIPAHTKAMVIPVIIPLDCKTAVKITPNKKYHTYDAHERYTNQLYSLICCKNETAVFISPNQKNRSHSAITAKLTATIVRFLTKRDTSQPIQIIAKA